MGILGSKVEDNDNIVKAPPECDAKICKLLRKKVFGKLVNVNACRRYNETFKSLQSVIDKITEWENPSGHFNHPDNCSCEEVIKPNIVFIRLLTLALDDDSEAVYLRNDFVERLLDLAPDLIMNINNKGQSALHLALLQENGQDNRLRILEKMISKLPDKEELNKNDAVCPSEITSFRGTKMEAGTILGVAALSTTKNKKKIFKKLLKAGFRLSNRTKSYDNILHSLIRYRNRKQDDEEVQSSTLQMLKLILHESEEPLSLLTNRNRAHISPVQQAALYGDFVVFELLMSRKELRKEILTDGLIDVLEYDITDIETVPPRQANDAQAADLNITTSSKEDNKITHVSILEYIAHHQSEQVANDFVNFPPIRHVIRIKWSYYRILLSIWFIFHLLATVVLSATGYYRTILHSNRTSCESCPGDSDVRKNSFGLTVASLICGVIYIFPLQSELVRKILSSKKRSSKIPSLAHAYSNLWFRILFTLIGPLIIIDSILALVNINSSFLLPLTLIMTCFLFLFFFQVVSYFSSFTVIIQKVIPDMIKFAFIMTTLLFGFSMAMFSVMHDEDDAFESFSKAVVKMLSIMIGLGDIDNLFQSKQPYVSIGIFILFVLLTTILLLNALIAIMSNTCSLIADGEHTVLQRLSVILFIEHMCICDRLLKVVGRVTDKNRRMSELKTLSEETAIDQAGGTMSSPGQMLAYLFHGRHRPQRRKPRKNTTKQKHNTDDRVPNTQMSNRQEGLSTLEISPQEDTKFKPKQYADDRVLNTQMSNRQEGLRTLEISSQEDTKCSECGSASVCSLKQVKMAMTQTDFKFN